MNKKDSFLNQTSSPMKRRDSQSDSFIKPIYSIGDIHSVTVTTFDRVEDVSFAELIYKEGNEFFVYWIGIKTKQLQYQIPRRFKEFYELHTFLKTNRDINYAKFPKRTIFSINSQYKLEKRKDKLNSFMQFLHETCITKNIPEFFDFIEVEEFMIRQQDLSIKYASDNKFDRKSHTLLYRLNYEEENRLTVLKDIEKFFVMETPRLSHQGAKVFMLGDSTMKGFADICGKLKDESHLVCSSGIRLLGMLISPYHCFHNHQILLNLFIKMKPVYLRTLELEQHLKCSKLVGCKRSALGLLKVYIQNNPEYKVDDLILDNDAKALFGKWVDLHKVTSVRSEMMTVEEEKKNFKGFNFATKRE